MNVTEQAKCTELAIWQRQWQIIVTEHFAAARARVDAVYQLHFASLAAVSKRHWQHRADIPRDLLNLPRAAWRLTSRIWQKHGEPGVYQATGKELALIKIINDDLLALAELQAQFHQHLQRHPNYDSEVIEELESVLQQLKPDHAELKLQIAVERLRLSHEGSRDLLLFISLGLLSRALADKVAYGGAAAIGSALATSVYLGQQSFLGTLWATWFGAPTWVAAAGAVGGIGLVLLATPLLSPLTETGINRFRAKKVLHRIVDETERQTAHAKIDLASSAGQIATYLQLIPDVVQLLKQIR